MLPSDMMLRSKGAIRINLEKLSLPRISAAKSCMDPVQDCALALTPQRRDQKVSGTVSRKTVDHGIRGQSFHAVNNQLDVFFHFHDRKGILLITDSEICIFQYVKKLQLDPPDVTGIQI